MVRGEFEHILTVDELANHNHTVWTDGITGNGNTQAITANRVTGSLAGWSATTSTTGRTQPHNNMPPYQVGYKWKRVG